MSTVIFKTPAEIVPLLLDADEVVRVSGTRVTLDTLISGFLEGATAEELAQQYPSVPLADVYSVISFYLHNRTKVEEYLQRYKQESDRIRKKNEALFSPIGIRERLLARNKHTSS